MQFVSVHLFTFGCCCCCYIFIISHVILSSVLVSFPSSSLLFMFVSLHLRLCVSFVYPVNCCVWFCRWLLRTQTNVSCIACAMRCMLRLVIAVVVGIVCELVWLLKIIFVRALLNDKTEERSETQTKTENKTQPKKCTFLKYFNFVSNVILSSYHTVLCTINFIFISCFGLASRGDNCRIKMFDSLFFLLKT